jgi:hypothetical protein
MYAFTQNTGLPIIVPFTSKGILTNWVVICSPDADPSWLSLIRINPLETGLPSGVMNVLTVKDACDIIHSLALEFLAG